MPKHRLAFQSFPQNELPGTHTQARSLAGSIWGVEKGKGFPRVNEDIFLEKGGVGDACVVNKRNELCMCVTCWETVVQSSNILHL